MCVEVNFGGFFGNNLWDMLKLYCSFCGMEVVCKIPSLTMPTALGKPSSGTVADFIVFIYFLLGNGESLLTLWCSLVLKFPLCCLPFTTKWPRSHVPSFFGIFFPPRKAIHVEVCPSNLCSLVRPRRDQTLLGGSRIRVQEPSRQGFRLSPRLGSLPTCPSDWFVSFSQSRV